MLNFRDFSLCIDTTKELSEVRSSSIVAELTEIYADLICPTILA